MVPLAADARRRKALAVGWLLTCALLSSTWCLTAAPFLGATFDEPTYVATGLDRWRVGGIGGLMRLGVMPLPVDVTTLPVWLAERWRDRPFQIQSDGRGRVVNAADLHEALPIARAATLVFWWLLLVSAWRLAQRLAGPWAGAVTVGLLAAEPSMLAHATLATTDVAVCAFLLAFAVSVSARSVGTVPSTSRRTWIVPGVWFGLAVLSKASALVFAPLIAFAAAWGAGAPGWRAFTRTLAKMTAVALALVFVYCGSDWQVEESFIEFARALPAGPVASGLQGIAQHLSIFSNAGEGLVQQVKHNVRGHDAFVLGRAYARAVWFYFPIVLAIKTSAGLLVGLAALAVFRRLERRNWVLVAAGVIVLCSPLFRVQTGIRMILPVIAFAIVGLAVALDRAQAEGARRATRILVRNGAIVLVLWSVVSAWRIWPDGLRFANELWGGPDAAFELVSDSNYDWGQGLPELRQWRDTRPAPAMTLWYWGSDPSARSGPWQLLDIRAIGSADEDTIRQLLRGRLLAVSATLLWGTVLVDEVRVSPGDEQVRRTAGALRRVLAGRDWVARTRTAFIYDFTHDAGDAATRLSR